MSLIEIYTHDELVERAGRWLANAQKCSVVFKELVTYTPYGEIPDAIGFKTHGDSILVECKTSLSDFAADNKKNFRRIFNRGMGRYRYYLCPPNVIFPEDLIKNHREKWGLLWVKPRSIKMIKEAEISERNYDSEMSLFMSCLKRVSMATPEHFPGGIFTNLTYQHAKAMKELELQRIKETREGE